MRAIISLIVALISPALAAESLASPAPAVFVSGGPRDPLKKRISLSDSIMHLIEDRGEILSQLKERSRKNSSATFAERYIEIISWKVRRTGFYSRVVCIIKRPSEVRASEFMIQTTCE